MSSYYCSGCDRIVESGLFSGASHGPHCPRRRQDQTAVLPGETFDQVRQRSHANHRQAVAMLIASVVGGLVGYSRSHDGVGGVVGAVIGALVASTRLGSQLVLWGSVLAIGLFLWQFTH